MAGHILSYSAGSTSTDPYGFREIDDQASDGRMARLLSLFPRLAEQLSGGVGPLLVNAYPATLGGLGKFRSVDTYLHPPTCIRAMHLAAIESRSVIFAAQPLMGAEMLLRAHHESPLFPSQVIWATGGYPLPRSLEFAVRSWLAERDAELTILSCYGVAELDHTLMAATDRDDQDQWIYHIVHPELNWVPEPEDSTKVSVLRLGEREVVCNDEITWNNTSFRIGGDDERFQASVIDDLESWTESDWCRRTGYAGTIGSTTCFQLRENVRVNVGHQVRPHILKFEVPESASRAVPESELAFHRFAERFGMSWQQKPRWNRQPNQQRGYPRVWAAERVDAA